MRDENKEQSRAITEIAGAVRSMDTATQQNAAMVEATTAAARNLSGEVLTLAERAAAFQVDKERHNQTFSREQQIAVPSSRALH